MVDHYVRVPPVRSASEVFATIDAAAPPTAAEVSRNARGEPLDTREKLLTWLVEIGALDASYAPPVTSSDVADEPGR